jgi:hypothetical protein
MPMALSPILRRSFAEQDRAEAQERIITAVEGDAERFLRAYAQLPDSFEGRYISADLFKETFAIYAASAEARGRYNAAAHNAAAVLSAAQFERALQGAGADGVFLTGVPGSGKTTTVLAGGKLPAGVRFVFEGQLSRPQTGMEKLTAAIRAGVAPTITAVLARPEEALANTFTRFETLGRGASVALMAEIAGELPQGLEAIRARFGDAVKLQVIDVRDRAAPKTYRGWTAIEVLREEGNREQIAGRLARALERARRDNRVSADTYDQAIGRPPFAGYRGLDAKRFGGTAPDGDGPRISAEGSESDFVAAEAGTAVSTAEAVDREAEAIVVLEHRWNATLDAAIEGKQVQSDRLIDRLETMIEQQEIRVINAKAAKPGLLAMPGQREKAQRRIEQAERSLALIQSRLERVREIRNEQDPDHPRSLAGLARAKAQADEAALFAELAAYRVAQTMREVERRRKYTRAGDEDAARRGVSLNQRLEP